MIKALLISIMLLCTSSYCYAANKQVTYVYVTPSGSKYHRYNCRYVRSYTKITLEEARRLYNPCGVCKPPR